MRLGLFLSEAASAEGDISSRRIEGRVVKCNCQRVSHARGSVSLWAARARLPGVVRGFREVCIDRMRHQSDARGLTLPRREEEPLKATYAAAEKARTG